MNVGHGVTLAHMLAPGSSPGLNRERILQGILREAVRTGIRLSLIPRRLDKIHTMLFGTVEEKSVMRLLMVVLDKVRVHFL